MPPATPPPPPPPLTFSIPITNIIATAAFTGRPSPLPQVSPQKSFTSTNLPFSLSAPCAPRSSIALRFDVGRPVPPPPFRFRRERARRRWSIRGGWARPDGRYVSHWMCCALGHLIFCFGSFSPRTAWLKGVMWWYRRSTSLHKASAIGSSFRFACSV